MGSDSDAPVMQGAVDLLTELKIPWQMTVASAHRSPERVMRLVSEAPGRGVKAFIVGAGAAAHLAGVVAAHTSMPVIGVPIDSSALKGLDALLSTVQMPPGVPVATVSIGKPGATNAAVLAAQILAVGDSAIAERVVAYKKKLAEKVEAAAAKLEGEEPPRGALRRGGIAPGHEVRDRHLRLPGQPGRFAPSRGAPSPSWRRSSSADADVVIVNTCSVTATADQGARQTIRRIARENPAAQIVATGCYATRRPAEVESLPDVVRVVRNDVKLGIGTRSSGARRPSVTAGGDGPAAVDSARAGRTHGIYAARADRLRPAVRLLHHPDDPRPRSQPAVDAGVAEATRVAQAGFGRSRSPACISGSYGRDLAAPSSLFELLCALERARARRDVQDQFSRADGLLARDRRPRLAERRTVRAALPSAAAARERPHAARPCAVPTQSTSIAGTWTPSSSGCRTRRSAPT